MFGVVAAAAGVLLAAALPASAPVAGPAALPRESFDRGRTAFGRAEYQRAIDILHPLLYPEVVLESDGEIVQAHRMLGVSYLFANKPDDAQREFRKLLELRPDFRFDPLLDPQQVVDFFNGVVKQQEATIAAILARRRKQEQDTQIRRKRESERVLVQPPTIVRYERRSFVLNFVPFGAGQFQNGHRGKGWFFLGVESTLAAISVGAFAANLALYGLEPRRKCLEPPPVGTNGQPSECPADKIDYSQENNSELLLRIQLVSGGLFFAAAIWGVIDAIRHHQRDVRIAGEGSVRLTITPHGLGAAWTF